MRTLLMVMMITVQVYAYTLEVGFDDFRIETDDTGMKGEFDKVRLAGGTMLPVDPGCPSLPGYPVSVALPQGTVIDEVNVVYAEPVELPGTYYLAPMQKPQPIGSEPEYTEPDEATYSSTAAFPGRIAYSHHSSNRGGYHVGSILFAPVQYIPATGKITVYTSISFDVTLAAADCETVYPSVRMEWVDEQIRRNVENSVINPGEVVPPAGTRVLNRYSGYKDDVFPYLIISGSADTAALNNLVEWKTRKGNKPTVVTVDDISANYTGVDTADKIRDCIVDYYTNFGTQYVLLVGNNSYIPMRYTYDIDFYTYEGNYLVPTDNYYGCLDGDWNADGDNYWGEYEDDNVDYGFDVYVGRIQDQEPANVAGIVDKTLCYEGTGLSSMTNPYDYDGEVLLAGAWLDASTNMGEGMEYIRDNCMNGPFWDNEILQDTSYSGTSFNALRFRKEMALGRNLIAHSAHSFKVTLGTNSGYVYSSHLGSLVNNPRFTGCLYSLGCYQGHIETTNNCAACFIRNPGGGGVGYIGNTRYGFYIPGNPRLNSGMYLEEYFRKIGTENIGGSGEAYVEHKHGVDWTVMYDVYRYIHYELYLTGDPDLRINKGNVLPLDVTYDSYTPLGEHSYSVHLGASNVINVAGAMVCIWKGDEVYDCGLTDANGGITFDINPTSEGTMYLTATARNYETFEANVTVSDEVGIYLAYFEGSRTKEGVKLEWEAINDGGEIYTYNLYRREKAVNTSLSGNGFTAELGLDGWVKVNAQPITGGNPYSYLDEGVSEGEYEYMLEAVADTSAEKLGTTNVFVNAPRVYALYQSRPNPTEDVATIAFNLAKSGHTTLEVFDITGRKVMTLADETLAEGEHARTVSGIASGVYLYRLDSGDFTATKKMVIK